MSAPNGNVTAWISVAGATLITALVIAMDVNLAPAVVSAYFAFIGGLAMGRYMIPMQRPVVAPQPAVMKVALRGLVIGRRQTRLVALFTLIETIVLTIWGYLFYLWISTGDPFYFIVAFLELFTGLELEHTIATETGNLGPNDKPAANTQRVTALVGRLKARGYERLGIPIGREDPPPVAA